MKKIHSSFESIQALFSDNQIIVRSRSSYEQSKEFFNNMFLDYDLLMKTCKGRDKFCYLIQVYAEFVLICLKNTNIKQIQILANSDKFLRKKIAKSIIDSMQNGRKIFKFLKFIECFNKFRKTAKDERLSSYVKYITLIRQIMSFFYNIIDNILWGIKIGVLNDVISKQTEISINQKKNTISLIKSVFGIFLSMINFSSTQIKSSLITRSIIKLNPEDIQNLDNNLKSMLLLKYYRCRKNKYLVNIKFFKTILNLINLSNKTIFSKNKLLNPVFIGICEIIQAFTQIIQLIIKNKQLYLKSGKNNHVQEKPAGQKSYASLQNILELD